MDMEHVSAGKNAGNRGFQALVYRGAVGNGRHLYPEPGGEFIFRNQADGKEESITWNIFLRSGYGLSVFIHLCERNTLYPFLAVNVDDGVAQLQGNAEILKALDNISLQAAGIRHQLRNHLYLCTLQSHAACHDQANVAGAQDDDLPARHKALHVDQTLCGPGRVDSGGTVAGDIQRASGTFSAAHGENDGFCTKDSQAVCPVHGGNSFDRHRFDRFPAV